MVKKLFKKKGGFDFGSSPLLNELYGMPGLLIVITNYAFKLQWANDYFYEYFKCLPEDMAERPLHDFLGEDVRGDMNEKHINRLIESGNVWDHFARTIDANGEFVIIRWNQLTFNDNGAWILSVGFPPVEKPSNVNRTPVAAERAEPVYPGLAPDIYTPADFKEDQELAFDIAQLVSAKKFIMHYQPRVHARTKAIIGAEGLLRINHPKRGLLYPATFLPVAERSEHILEIGAYVVDAACKKLHDWHDMGIVPSDNNQMLLSISINVSPKQLNDSSFVQTLLAASSRHRVEPIWLMLELSEQTIAANFSDAQRIIQMLKSAGFMVAVDDYSSNFLSLSALTKLAVDNITIDPAYLTQSEQDQSVYLVMESIITLAHGLNMTVTAGGIENRKQLDFLLDNSVDFLQGYLISEPLPEAEFDRFLKTNPDFYTRHI